MMEENVVSAAGTSFRLTVDEIRNAPSPRSATRPRQRDNWYRSMPALILDAKR